MSLPLPDNIVDAIDRAARLVKRRSDYQRCDPKGDPPAPDDSLDAFTEDIEAELTRPVGELAHLNLILRENVRLAAELCRAGRGVDAARLLEATLGLVEGDD